MKKQKSRCDHCGKWVGQCELVTFHEEYFLLLNGDDEFSFCIDCMQDKKYSKEYWLKWIEKKRKILQNRPNRYV